MNDETITIGVTAYNAQDTIAAALESAMAQSLPIHEIIVVDDASTDGTAKILDRYRRRHPNLSVVRNPQNMGVAAARNEILRRATGVFVAFFDDDDMSAPDRIEAQRARILDYERDFADGAAVICHTARRQLYPDGTERIEPAMGSDPGLAPHGLEVVRYTLMGEPLRGGYGSCATCSQMARTETYRFLGGFDTSFRRCEDSDLAIRHALAGGHFIGVSAPMVTQRMTGTPDKSVIALMGHFKALQEKHRNVFDTAAQFAFNQGWIEAKFAWMAGQRGNFAARLAALTLRYPFQTRRRLRAALPNLAGNKALQQFLRRTNRA